MFKTIPDYPMYMVNEDGEVLSLYTHKKRKPWVGRDGYPRISLWKDDKHYTVEVHRLVASAFLEKPEGRDEIHHLDHDKTNNNYKNLLWVSHKENLEYDFKDQTRDPHKCGMVYRYNIYLLDEFVCSCVGLVKCAEITGQAETSCWRSAYTGKPMASGYRIEKLEGYAKKDMGVWNHYSAYKDGELIAEGISVWDCAGLSGYSTRRIRESAQKGFTTTTGWRFERK